MNAESARHFWNQKKVIVVFSVHMERQNAHQNRVENVAVKKR